MAFRKFVVMKKWISIFLSSLYLCLSLGLVLEVHFCSGQAQDLAVFSSKSPCCCGPIEAFSNCCSDEQVVLDVQGDEFPSSTLFLQKTFIPQPIAEPLQKQSIVPPLQSLGVLPQYNTGPPPSVDKPILFCALIFYA